MKAMEGDQTLMRIFIGDRDRIHGRPLADVLVELLRSEGFAGATVLHGTQGFGAHSRMLHRDSILRLSEDLPVVLEVVDSEEKVRGILPRLEEMIDGGLITFERVHVIRYRGHAE
jgi:PII-like signaling protein